jgi:hypothetical protein
MSRIRVLPGFGIAIPAKHRFIAPGLEGDFRLFAALGAGGGIHLAGTPVRGTSAVTTVTLRFPGLPARRTALGLIGEALGGIKFLLFNREGKVFSAIGTLKGFLCIGH